MKCCPEHSAMRESQGCILQEGKCTPTWIKEQIDTALRGKFIMWTKQACKILQAGTETCVCLLPLCLSALRLASFLAVLLMSLCITNWQSIVNILLQGCKLVLSSSCLMYISRVLNLQFGLLKTVHFVVGPLWSRI